MSRPNIESWDFIFAHLQQAGSLEVLITTSTRMVEVMREAGGSEGSAVATTCDGVKVT